MTWLGVLNFAVLQWFGVRLARVTEQRTRFVGTGTFLIAEVELVRVTVGWKLLRWIWPLTGWWSDYRWIARLS